MAPSVSFATLAMPHTRRSADERRVAGTDSAGAEDQGGAVMRIHLGANVKTKDGHRAGKITKVIWDPDRNEVREFVVSTGGLLGHDVIVSREVLERATPAGDELVVDLTKDELDQMDHYDDRA